MPCGAGQRQRVQRRATRSRTLRAPDHHAALRGMPSPGSARHDPLRGGTIMPGRPVGGFGRLVGASAAAGACGRIGLAAPARSAPAVAGRRRNVVRAQPVLAVGDLVGPGLAPTNGLSPDRREVELAVLDDRRQILRAQFRRLFGAQPGGGLNCPAQERDRVVEVVTPAPR